MLETRNAPIEFLGKDGFHWFIGQVTPDPAWRDKNDQKYTNGFRAKVRILGYHPGENAEEGGIDDEDLPWAHFLVSPQFGAGNNYCGTSFALQGGETVIGFFLDGEEAQQPVVIGAFYANDAIVDPQIWKDAMVAGTSHFKPIAFDDALQQGKNLKPTQEPQPPAKKKKNKNTNKNNNTSTTATETSTGNLSDKKEEVEPNPNKPDPRGGIVRTTGEILNARQELISTINTIKTNIPIKIEQADAECTKPAGMGGEITTGLQTFIDGFNKLEQYKDGYIDPVLGTLVNVDKMIDKASKEIDGAISGLLRKTRTEMFKVINTGIEEKLSFLEPDFLIKELEVLKQQDAIFCGIENILKGLQNTIKDFLKELMGKLVDMPLCAAEGFLGGLLGDITDKIQGAIAPMIASISKLSGIQIPSFMDMLGDTMKLPQLGLQLLECEGNFCNPEPMDFITNLGPDPKTVMNISNVMNKATETISGAGIKDVVNGMFPGIEGVTGAISKVAGIKGAVSEMGLGNMESLVGSCNPFKKRCGPPRIEIFGGGGLGAVANAVVNQTGKVIGVNMKQFGSQFGSSPYVSINDDCGKGGGAAGKAVVDTDPESPTFGQITNVIITNPGSGYLGPETATSDDEGVDVIGQVDGAQVISTGSGYSPDTIVETATGCPLNCTVENGRIVSVTGSCDLGLTDIPELFITDPTNSGYGAILRPITKFTKREDYEIESAIPSDATLIRVVDCARIY